MFTGLVEAVGVVRDIRKTGSVFRLSVESSKIAPKLELGQSVSVCGACLTVVSTAGSAFDMEMIPETLTRTRFSSLARGSLVNLERAMKLDGRLEGHLLLGHVDGTAVLEKLTGPDRTKTAFFRVSGSEPGKIMRYVVSKGSVAVDGVSLTVIEAGDDYFSVGIIPATLENTTLGQLKRGDAVNVETDIIGKYVERLLGGFGGRLTASKPSGGASKSDFLNLEELCKLGYG